MENVGLTLKLLRKERKLTLREVAAISGITYTYISDLEKEKSPLSLKILDRLCKAYNVYPWQVLMKAQISTRLTEQTQKKIRFSIVGYKYGKPIVETFIINNGVIKTIDSPTQETSAIPDLPLV